MPRQVYLENWQEQLEAAIEAVTEMTAVNSSSPEQEALLGKLRQLKEMARQIQEVSPSEREEITSFVIALTVREHLRLPDDLAGRLGDLFDIYRRFRNRLSWNQWHISRRAHRQTAE